MAGLPPGARLVHGRDVDLPAGYSSRLVMEAAVPGGVFTADAVEKFINGYLAARPDKQVFVRYFSALVGEWRTYGLVAVDDKMTLGESISTYEGDFDFEGDDVRAIDFLVGDRPRAAGGCDGERNDCLARALSLIFAGKIPGGVIKGIEHLKVLLGVAPNDPVPVAKLAHVDELLGATAALSCEGDYPYQSPKVGAPLIARIKLKNGHFEARSDPKRRVYQRTHYKSPKPVRFIMGTENPEVHDTYDVNGVFVEHIDTATMKRWLADKIFTAPVMAVRARNAEYFTEWRASRDALKGILEIDLCGSVKKAALHLWRSTSKCLPAPAPCDATEARWITGALGGGLVWAQPGEFGGLEVDACSHYASTVMRPNLMLPSRAGVFSTLRTLS